MLQSGHDACFECFECFASRSLGDPSRGTLPLLPACGGSCSCSTLHSAQSRPLSPTPPRPCGPRLSTRTFRAGPCARRRRPSPEQLFFGTRPWRSSIGWGEASSRPGFRVRRGRIGVRAIPWSRRRRALFGDRADQGRGDSSMRCPLSDRGAPRARRLGTTAYEIMCSSRIRRFRTCSDRWALTGGQQYSSTVCPPKKQATARGRRDTWTIPHSRPRIAGAAGEVVLDRSVYLVRADCSELRSNASAATRTQKLLMRVSLEVSRREKASAPAVGLEPMRGFRSRTVRCWICVLSRSGLGCVSPVWLGCLVPEWPGALFRTG